MKYLKKEIKYSVKEDEIKVILDKVWPVVFVNTYNYELIDYVLKDINNNYLTDNGAFIIVENQNKEIMKILENNNYEFFSMNCLVKAEQYSIDKNLYQYNCVISDEVKQYYSNYFNKLTGLNNGKELIDIIQEPYQKFYVFYEKNKIVGIAEIRIIDNDISIRQIFSDNKEIIKFIIKCLSNEFKLDMTIGCDSNNKLLLEVLKEMNVKILCSKYVFTINN